MLREIWSVLLPVVAGVGAGVGATTLAVAFAGLIAVQVAG
jgi:hypothetical protein